jgi:hypothetical protein
VIRQDHAAAFLALMATFAGGAPVFDGEVPEEEDGTRAEPPYRLVHFQFLSPGSEDRPDLIDIEDATRPLEMRAFVHSVAETARAARSLADQTYSVVADQELVVAGRTSFRVRHEDSQPPDRDQSTGVTVFSAVDVYRMTSMPA